MDLTSFYKKPISSLLVAITVGFTPVTNATKITGTVVTDTEINKGKVNQQEVVTENKYDRPPMSDQQLEAVMKTETTRLNALFQSSMKNILIDTDKFGDPNMVVIGRDDTASLPIQAVVAVDSIVSGENRKRQLEEMVAQAKYKQGQITKEQLDNQVLRSVFPVLTTMKPTRLPSRKIVLEPEATAAITRPIAVIGSDKYSLDWFKSNLGALRRLNAAVIVTEVKSLTDFQAINTFAPDLMYQPMDASEFLKAIGVHTYPILLTNEGGIQ